MWQSTESPLAKPGSTGSACESSTKVGDTGGDTEAAAGGDASTVIIEGAWGDGEGPGEDAVDGALATDPAAVVDSGSEDSTTSSCFTRFLNVQQTRVPKARKHALSQCSEPVATKPQALHHAGIQGLKERLQNRERLTG